MLILYQNSTEQSLIILNLHKICLQNYLNMLITQIMKTSGKLIQIANKLLAKLSYFLSFLPIFIICMFIQKSYVEHIYTVFATLARVAELGRRTGLKILWVFHPCRFDSGPGHCF